MADEAGLETAPILSTPIMLTDTMDTIIDSADGMSKLNPNVRREGIVFRVTGIEEKIGFKVISNKFLLKQK